MNETNWRQETAEEPASPQNFGAGKPDRHDRETLAILGKAQGMSRETIRKIEKVDKEAPAMIRKAMGKTISIHKAAELNKLLRRLPEGEREAAAIWLLQKDVTDRASGTRREKRIAGKLSDVMSIARLNEGLLTEESVDIYLKYNLKSPSDIADMLDGEIYRLSKLKLIVQNRRLKECGAKE
jgi:hypothetical protein